VRALAALLGLSRVSLTRVGLALALFVLALGLAIAAFAQLIDALELALVMLIGDPALASLIAALILLALASLSLLVGRLYMRREARAAHVAAAGARAELLVQAMTLVRRNSGQAALIAAIVGFLVGILPDVRRAFGDRPDSGKGKSREEPPQEP
jgi:hypothetical protein